MKKITLAVLSITMLVVILPLLSPNSYERSTNPCSRCHGGYYQYLDIVEEEPTNQMPTTLSLNETKTVSVAIQNLVNTDEYSLLSGVTLKLSSSYGHFSVNSSTVSIGNLPPGKKTASWQVTGISDGFDYLVISATAYNTHLSDFSDSYSPAALITVGNATGTPPPPSSPQPSPAPTPTPSPTPTPTPTPEPEPTTPPVTTETPVPNEPAPESVQNLSITLTSPNEEKWQPQAKQNIKWNASGGTAPIEIKIEYRKTGSKEWTEIATGLPNNGSFTWKTPYVGAIYEVQVTAMDSANPPQTTSATSSFEIVQAETDSGLPVIPVAAVAIGAVAVGAVLSVRKMKLGRQKNTGKIIASKVDGDLPKEQE